MEVAGTWTGALGYTLKNGSGAQVATGTDQQAIDVTPTGSGFTYFAATSNGGSGTCTGSLSGTAGTSSCQLSSLDGQCSYSPTRTESIDATASPPKWTSTWTATYVGSSCSLAGYTVTAQATYTRQVTAPLNVAGTWSGTGTNTKTGPGLQPVTSQTTSTRIRTQNGSWVHASITSSNGSSQECGGVLIGNVGHAYCEGSSGACTFTGDTTATVDPNANPMTETVSSTYKFGSNCGGYTDQTGSSTYTKTGP